jgi:serine phosphatase RsbU (regulator of sigma subunit)
MYKWFIDHKESALLPVAFVALALIGFLDSLSLYVTQSLLYGMVCFGAGYLNLTGKMGLVIAAIVIHVVADDTKIAETSLMIQSFSEAVLLVLICHLGTVLRQRQDTLKTNNEEIASLHQRLLNHLERARAVQEEILGNAPTASGRLKLSVQYEVAVEVGGDVYFAREVSKGLLIFVGDISGKGPRAAIAAACVRVLLEEAVEVTTDSPSSLLAHLQKRFMELFPNDLFLTCFCAIVEQSDERLVYSIAGHDPPLLRRPDGKLVELEGDSMPVGLDLSEAYANRQLAFAPGDSLLVYTDGLVDARQPSGERLGIDYVMNAFRQFDGNCEEFAQRMLSLAPAPRADDIMILVLAFLPI